MDQGPGAPLIRVGPLRGLGPGSHKKDVSSAAALAPLCFLTAPAAMTTPPPQTMALNLSPNNPSLLYVSYFITAAKKATDTGYIGWGRGGTKRRTDRRMDGDVPET